jgi:hypothetical protein
MGENPLRKLTTKTPEQQGNPEGNLIPGRFPLSLGALAAD